MTTYARALLVIAVLVGSVAPAAAQAPASNDEWKVNVYPILGWAPIFGADVNLPSVPGGPGGGTEASTESSLNGALMFGIAIEHGPWRVDADGIWAALTGDRPTPPTVKVDLDLVYGHVSGGRKVFKDLSVTAGVRRIALKYDIQLGGLPSFSRKPGVWDPLVGIGWHYERTHVEVHATLEGGGFGVGADQDISAGVRVDLKPVSHFGVTVGYAGLKVKVTDTLLTKTFTADQTLHGPVLGIGFYF
jgi:hypothetical protein